MKEIDFGTYSSVFELLPSGSYLHGLIAVFNRCHIPAVMAFSSNNFCRNFLFRSRDFFTAGIFENTKVRMQLYK